MLTENGHKIIDFKTVSPLYEMECNGVKHFTERLLDYDNTRFRALAQWQPGYRWKIRITNPATTEHFTRNIINVSRLCVLDRRMLPVDDLRCRQLPGWLVIEWDYREVRA